MHIHGGMRTQGLLLVPTQSAQQASAARKTAAQIRRKLSRLAAASNTDAVSYVEAYVPGGRGHRQASPQEEETFRNVFVSVQV